MNILTEFQIPDKIKKIKNPDCVATMFVENTISNSPEVARAKFLGKDKLFCFISLNKFGNFKNTFATITNLPEFHFLDENDSFRC